MTDKKWQKIQRKAQRKQTATRKIKRAVLDIPNDLDEISQLEQKYLIKINL